MNSSPIAKLLDRLNIDLPIIQAAMAGVSSPAMAAAVSEAGGLGSLGVGATDAAGAAVPSYPIAYDLAKALHAAAKAEGEFGFGAPWAGQGAPLARRMSAGALTRLLAEETR